MAAGGSGGRASCPPGVGPGAGGGPGPSANTAPAPGNAAAAAAAPAPAVPGPPPPVSVSVSGPGAQAAAGGERAAEEPGAAALLREPVYNWQATKPTVKERFAFLFNNEVLCDVHFLVGKGLGAQRIPAHRWAAVRDRRPTRDRVSTEARPPGLRHPPRRRRFPGPGHPQDWTPLPTPSPGFSHSWDPAPRLPSGKPPAPGTQHPPFLDPLLSWGPALPHRPRAPAPLRPCDPARPPSSPDFQILAMVRSCDPCPSTLIGVSWLYDP